MAKLYNLARMTTATTGTGTITLGSAVSSYLSFASSGVLNGETVTYAIVDGSNREVGRGVYTSVGTTLTRATILESTNANAAINLSGSAEVFITAAAEDITSSVEITGGSITGITDLVVADGGTGVSSLTAYAVLAGGTTSTGAVQTVSGLGTSGQVLTSNGASALPTWASPSAGSGTLLRAPQILTTGTSYTTPAGCNSIYVELVGGGGGSGGMQVTTDNAGFGVGGGGSGGYAAKYFSVSPSTAYTYAIGAGGTAGANTGTNGGNGGNTTFTALVSGVSTTVTANGGSGSAGTGANFASNFGTVGGNGGGNSNGDINVPGNPGNAGVSSGVAGVGGNGGGSFFGGGGKGGFQSATGNSNGDNGSRGGGAGGPAIRTATGTEQTAGQSGSAGVIRVWEYS